MNTPGAHIFHSLPQDRSPKQKKHKRANQSQSVSCLKMIPAGDVLPAQATLLKSCKKQYLGFWQNIRMIFLERRHDYFFFAGVFVLRFFLFAMALRKFSGRPRALPAFFLLSESDLAQSGWRSEKPCLTRYSLLVKP